MGNSRKKSAAETIEVKGRSASKTSSKKDDSATGSKKKNVSGAGARRKGLAFERQIATALGTIFPNAQRELEFQEAGNAGTDIFDTDIFQIQCKRWANYCPIGTIEEVRLRKPDNIPVLVTQGNRKECMAVLPFEKFVTLLEIAYGLAPRLIHPDLKQPAVLRALPHENNFGKKEAIDAIFEEVNAHQVAIMDGMLKRDSELTEPKPSFASYL